MKRNPHTMRTRARLPERDVLSRDEMLDVAMFWIYQAKGGISPLMGMSERKDKRTHYRNLFVEEYSKRYPEGNVSAATDVFRVLWNANATSMGYREERDNILVPLELLSRDQIRDMPRTSFTPEEWKSLSATDRKYIESSKETTARKIVDLSELIQGMYSDANDRSENYDTDEMLTDFIRHNASFAAVPAEHRYQRSVSKIERIATETGGEDEVKALYDYAQSIGGDTPYTLTDKLVDALEDEDNWEVEVEEWNGIEGFGIIEIPKSIEVDSYALEDLEAATQEELNEAFESANRAYPESEGFEDTLTKGVISKLPASGRSFDVEPSYIAILKPDWETIEENIMEELAELAHESEGEDQFYSVGEPEPEEDRILYTFKDGAYVLRMIPEDLRECGEELGQCIKDPEYNYSAKLNKGEIALYSIRTAEGRPKITIEIGLDDDGNPVRVGDILGKGNRVVGWGGTPGEGKVKWMETQKVGKVLELLGFDPEIRSLKGAQEAMRKLDPEMKLTQNPRRRRR